MSRASRAVRRAVEDAVAALGLSVAAGACECTPAELSDAVTGRKGRRLPFEWVMAVALVAGAEDRARIAAALLDPMGLVPTSPKPLDGEAYAALLEQRIAEQLGQAGVEVVRESRRAARR